MRRPSISTRETESGVDLNPMLDVVFILLIFFIVTASFVNEQTLSFGTTPTEGGKSLDIAPTLIRISSANDIYIDGRRVDNGAIRALLSQKYAEHQEASAIVVNAHEDAEARTYVAILDAAHQANYSRVSVTTFSE